MVHVADESEVNAAWRKADGTIIAKYSRRVFETAFCEQSRQVLCELRRYFNGVGPACWSCRFAHQIAPAQSIFRRQIQNRALGLARETIPLYRLGRLGHRFARRGCAEV